ncbi:MAG TPA: NAD(P)H-dependent oxidoreductase [Anaerolineaceae bacterium]
MKLTIFNGSPRRLKSNTKILFDQFIKGFLETPGNLVDVIYLMPARNCEDFQKAFADCDAALLGFPLYTDAMPGIVKNFIECLEIFKGRTGNPPIGFLVQSGFPEGGHSTYVEKYLAKLAKRLNSPYLGTIIKGGVEGIQIQPANMTRKLFDAFYRLGKIFGETGELDSKIIASLRKPLRYPAILIAVFWLLSKTNLLNFYWDDQLKKHGAYARRYSHPYDQPVDETHEVKDGSLDTQ